MEDGDLYESILHIRAEFDAYIQLRVVQEKVNRHLVHVGIGHGWLGLMQRGRRTITKQLVRIVSLKDASSNPLQYTMSTISWLSLLWN